MKESNAQSNPLSTTLVLRPTKLKCTSHTLLVNIRKNVSRRSNVQLLRDSPIKSWLVTTDKMVKSKWPSESSDKPLKSFTSSPDKTHSRFSSKLSFKAELEKTQPELVQEVPSEDKPSMFPHWEESTKLSISSARDPETHASDLTRPWAKPSPMRSSQPQRVLAKATPSPSRRRMKSRELPRVTDERTRFVVTTCFTLVTYQWSNASNSREICFICWDLKLL